MAVRRNFDLNDDARRSMKAVEREMERYGLLIVKEAADYLDRNKINVDGDLKKSLTHEVDDFLNGAAMRLTVGTNSQHAIYVHEGTRPRSKFPPIKPIRTWVKKKLGIAEEAKIKQVAFLIARSIKERGTSMRGEGSGKGPRRRPFLDRALEKYQDSFVRDMEAAFARGMA